ncbi:MAG TPA: hypothetical protein VJS64_14500, partial [Pyrinomonadaceae bacterium]|nr:hypothetical protein [Pyrinomonadaceae bacterium]
VTGEYIRNSQFLFDDRGRRIEKVLFHPGSTIREMRITKEDIQDLSDSQLLGIDIAEATKYHLTYAGIETVDSRQLFAIDVTPTVAPNPRRMKERFFIGRVWVEPNTFQIVKIKGIVEPQGKQRFPIFETWREPSKNQLSFPTRTEADDVLHFESRDVHYRIKVRYYEYKLFGSKVSITEVDGPAVEPEETAPAKKDEPRVLKPTNQKNNQATPKVKEVSPKASEKPVTQLPLFKTEPRNKPEVCTTNRNAPPVGGYHWPANSEVKVYFTSGMFTSAQSVVMLEAMKTWTEVGQNTGSGVKFIYAGETERRMNCRGCLTVSRRQVYKQDKHHYAFFNPMQQEGRGLLVSAWIDLDVGIKEPKALQGFMAHELGHGLGLWDCPSCKNKRSLMSSFPGLNKNNGLIAPSTCDVATMKGVYDEARQIASAKPGSDQRRATDRPDSIAIVSIPDLVGPDLPVLDLQRALVGGAAAKSSTSKQSDTIPVEHTFSLMTPAFAETGFLTRLTRNVTGNPTLVSTARREKSTETVPASVAPSKLGSVKGGLNFFDIHRPRLNKSLLLWDRSF